MKVVHGTEVLTTVDEWIDPKRTAIAVIDMQNEIVCEQGGYARQGIDTSPIRAIVPSIQRLLDAARRVGVVVAFAEYIHRNRLGVNMVDGANYYRNKDYQWVPCIQEGTWGAQTCEELPADPRDLAFVRSRGSIFSGNGLDNTLKELGIRSVVLVGTAIGGSLYHTYRDGRMRGYYTPVATDAVAVINDRIEQQILAHIGPGLTTSQIASHWEKEAQHEGSIDTVA